MTEPSTAQPAFAVPDALATLVRDGTLDAELAALLSLTVEGGIPLVVAGSTPDARRRVRDALLTLIPPGRPVVRLAGGDEDFAWMPEAGELGWRTTTTAALRRRGAVMVADLEATAGGASWGEAAHLAIRALTAGYSLVATAGGSGLAEVLARLSAAPVSAMDDELTRLGVVLVLADAPGDAPPAVTAAHYLRPVARDPGGHIQRLPPAVLATRSPASGSFDHFAWGVVSELAARTGRRQIAFEREQAERSAAILSAATADGNSQPGG